MRAAVVAGVCFVLLTVLVVRIGYLISAEGSATLPGGLVLTAAKATTGTTARVAEAAILPPAAGLSAYERGQLVTQCYAAIGKDGAFAAPAVVLKQCLDDVRKLP